MMIFFFPFLSTKLLWEMASCRDGRFTLPQACLFPVYVLLRVTMCEIPLLPSPGKSIKIIYNHYNSPNFFLCAWADENGNSDRAPQVDVFPWHKPSKGVVCWAWTGEGTSAAYLKCLSFVSNTWHPDIHCSLAQCEKLWWATWREVPSLRAGGYFCLLL